MSLSVRLTWISVCAALLIAVSSVLSAAALAPDRARDAFLAQGGALSDLCGDTLGDAGHRCPFCRLTDDPGQPLPPASRPDTLGATERPAGMHQTAVPSLRHRAAPVRAPPPAA